MTNKSKNGLARRLIPLNIAQFLQGFVLWYAIEKLFMTTIGFNSITIALSVVIYSAITLFTEIPFGILADRWSRKGVLILAGISFALSSLIAGLSVNVIDYIASLIFLGLFFALYSGVYDSIIYDMLVEEKGNADEYEKYYGRIKLFEGVSLILGSFAGGLIGQFFGLREAYFFSVPIALLSIVALIFLKEPKLHLIHNHISIRGQIKATIYAITQKGIVVYLLLSIVFAGLLARFVFEFDQLWLIALVTPAIFYGPINALLLSSVVIGSGIAQYVAKYKLMMIYISVVILLCAGVSLALFRNVFIVAFSEFFIATIVIIYEILFSKQLHDRLSSNIRSGAMSAANTLSRILFIFTALVFGYVSQYFGVFNAAWLVVGLIVITALIILRTSTGLTIFKSGT